MFKPAFLDYLFRVAIKSVSESTFNFIFGALAIFSDWSIDIIYQVTEIYMFKLFYISITVIKVLKMF